MNPKVWVVTIPSAYRPMHQCFLGSGTTKTLAMENAYGPKPWPKSSCDADCYEVTADEAERMQYDSEE